jgi:hypothetical protein
MGCNHKHHHYNHEPQKKLLAIKKRLKSEGHYQEAFRVSLMLLKLAQEQMEFEHEGFQQYSCAVCGKGLHHEQMYAASRPQLDRKQIAPKFDLPPDSAYPVCGGCNEEHFMQGYDNPEKPTYSQFRKTKLVQKCTRCGIPYHDPDEFDSEHHDYFVIHGIEIPEELKPNKLEPLDEDFLICNNCWHEVDDEAEVMCAICEEMTDEDETITTTREYIAKADVQPEYVLYDHTEYKVCYECNDDHLTKFCEICDDHKSIDEVESLEFEDEYKNVCEDCKYDLSVCAKCECYIYTADGEYYYDERIEEIYHSDCRPENVNDLQELENLADDYNDVLRGSPQRGVPFEEGTYMPFNSANLSRLAKMLQQQYDKSVRGDKELFRGKQSTHILKTIKRMRLEDEEKLFLLNFLTGQNVESPEEEIEEPIMTERAGALIEQAQISDNYATTVLSDYKLNKRHKYLKSMGALPVITAVTEPHDSSYYNSFVITLSANKEIEETAKQLWGPEALEVWRQMSQSGVHHDEAVAYCRIGNYEGEWLIENLQTDADVQKLTRQLENRNYIQRGVFHLAKRDPEVKARVIKIAKWWVRQFRGWEAYMIFLAKDMAEQSGVELYITDQAHQKHKWYSIPDRSSIIYDAIPQEMHGARMNKLKEEFANKHGIPVDQVPDSEIDMSDEFPRRENYIGDSESEGHLNSEFWRLANEEQSSKKIGS